MPDSRPFVSVPIMPHGCPRDRPLVARLALGPIDPDTVRETLSPRTCQEAS
jgi:hypothetical protein